MRTLWSIVIWASDHLSASLEVGRVSLVIEMRCKSPSSERLLKCNCSSLKLLRGLKSSVNRTHRPFGCVHWKPSHASLRSKYVHEEHRHRHRRYRLHRLEVLGACLPNRSVDHLGLQRGPTVHRFVNVKPFWASGVSKVFECNLQSFHQRGRLGTFIMLGGGRSLG